MRNNFRTFDIAVDFYKLSKALPLRGDARIQLDRAARSIALNLTEGRGKATSKDQKRFFSITFGSLRECQAVLIHENMEESKEWKLLDKLAAHFYRLIERG